MNGASMRSVLHRHSLISHLFIYSIDIYLELCFLTFCFQAKQKLPKNYLTEFLNGICNQKGVKSEPLKPVSPHSLPGPLSPPEEALASQPQAQHPEPALTRDSSAHHV